MSQEGFLKTPIFAQAGGENRVTPEILLPGNVSPNALNNDYSDGHLAKRRSGWRRAINKRFVHGAMALRQSIGVQWLSIAHVTAFQFATDFGYEIAVKIISLSGTSDLTVLSNRAASKGVEILLHWDGSKFVFRFGAELSTGYVSVDSSTLPVAGATIYRIAGSIISTAGVPTLHIDVSTDNINDNDTTVAGGAATYAYATAQATVIGKATAQTLDMIVDDIRITTTPRYFVTNDAALRELTDAEITAGGVVRNWRFDNNLNDLVAGQVITRSSTAVPKPIFCYAIVAGDSVTQTSGLFPVVKDVITKTAGAGNCLIFTKTELWQADVDVATGNSYAFVCYLQDFVNTGDSFDYPTNLKQYWTGYLYKKHTICIHQRYGNFRFKYGAFAALPFTKLSPDAPTQSAMTADKTGTGPGNITGDRSYLVTFTAPDGTESDIDTVVAHITTGTGAVAGVDGKYNLANIPVSLDAQVTGRRLYATKMATTSPFYFLHDIADNTATTYTDNAVDSGLVTLMNPFRGQAPVGAVDCFFWQYRLWMVYPDGLLYSEVDAGDGMAIWSAFYPYNFIELPNAVNSVEFPNPVNDITGAKVISPNSVFVTTKYRCFLLSGTAPGFYRIDELPTESGCINANTLVRSNKAIYMMTADGVQALGLGGQELVNISRDTNQSEFDDALEDGWYSAIGCWNPRLGQYILSYRSDNAFIRQTMVWTEWNGTWAKWDCQFNNLMVFPLDMQQRNFWGLWRGWLIEIFPDSANGVNMDDGVRIEGGTNPSTSKTPLAGSTARIVNFANTSFQTDLAGVKVTLVNNATGAREDNIIYWNTSNKLYFWSDFSVAPGAGYTIYLGGINWSWESPWLSLSGERDQEDNAQRLYFWTGANTVSGIVPEVVSAVVGSATPGGGNTWIGVSPTAINANKRMSEHLVKAKLRENKMRVSDYLPSGNHEIHGYRIGFEQAGVLSSE